MKSRLYARPVYLQTRETTTGHFLICCSAVLLTGLLQLKVLGSALCTREILDFAKGFTAAKKSDNAYINLTKNKLFITKLTRIAALPLTSYFPTDAQIKKIMNHRF